MTKTEQVTFPANGGSGQGYLAIPDGPGPHRAVVVIQEWWGLNEHIRDVARRFADAGYLALAPDLYHGAVADEPDQGHLNLLRKPQRLSGLQARGGYPQRNALQ